MKITFLGTGTSDGIPMVACNCDICRSKDKKDKRLRTSIMIEKNDKVIIVDTSIDFREQMLKNSVKHIDRIFLTHPHADHISGLVDIRSYNFIQGRKPIDIYANSFTIEEVKNRFSFFFNPAQRGGGVPQVNLIEMTAGIKLFNMNIIPLPVKHGKLDILGFRFNDFVYITDASKIEEETLKLIQNPKVLVLNALRYIKHSTHFSLQESVDIASEIGAEKTYLIHMTHDISHKRASKELPKNIHLAYDNLKIMV